MQLKIILNRLQKHSAFVYETVLFSVNYFGRPCCLI